MDKDEIRKFDVNKDGTAFASGVLELLREIAGQLAELNENIRILAAVVAVDGENPNEVANKLSDRFLEKHL